MEHSPSAGRFVSELSKHEDSREATVGCDLQIAGTYPSIME